MARYPTPHTALVLVVDDSATERFRLKKELEAEHFDVIVATDSSSALRLLAEQRPAVVIVDVLMPVTDGYELCRQIKSSPATGSVPVILTSGLGQIYHSNWQRDCPADAYVPKSVDRTNLLEVIRELLQ